MGAKVVERHVTLDKTLKGNDHEASLEPSELAELVRAIRLVEMAMGSPVEQTLPCEKNCHDKVGLIHSHHITSESLSSCRVYLHEIGIQSLSCMIVKMYKLLD